MADVVQCDRCGKQHVHDGVGDGSFGTEMPAGWVVMRVAREAKPGERYIVQKLYFCLKCVPFLEASLQALSDVFRKFSGDAAIRARLKKMEGY